MTGAIQREWNGTQVVGDYCIGSMTQPPMSNAEAGSRCYRCRHCGREVRLRVNIYGTVLGLPRHKVRRAV